jgi:hypothetical protein
MTQEADQSQTSNRKANELIRDLWGFIENVTDDDPERTDKFFSLRERVRNHFFDLSA